MKNIMIRKVHFVKLVSVSDVVIVKVIFKKQINKKPDMPNGEGKKSGQSKSIVKWEKQKSNQKTFKN